MVSHRAESLDSAGATVARVDALVALADLVPGTVSVVYALWPALDVRVAKVFRQTRADCIAILLRALGVDSARVGIAGISLDGSHRRGWND